MAICIYWNISDNYFFVIYHNNPNQAEIPSCCMKCREQRSHARNVYPIQDTSRMGTARVKQKEEKCTKIILKLSKKSGKKERRRKREKPKTKT